ncbi:MAG: SDR family oxidoreductase [Myxococcota bacterium]
MNVWSEFRDKVFLITGASSGIGKELSVQLARSGARLTLAARRAEKLEDVALEVERLGGQALVLPTDVGVEEQCARLIEQTVAHYGRLDALINNAGIMMWARFDELESLEPMERLMRVNYYGAVYCTHYALPHLKRARGRIVSISSLTGKFGVPTRSLYAATKHAMAGFFDSLRIELRDEGVAVTTVYPGFVAIEDRGRAMGPDGKPMGASPMDEDKAMSPEECASIILEACAEREREVIMTFVGKLGVFIKLLAPGLVDMVAAREVERVKR